MCDSNNSIVFVVSYCDDDSVPVVAVFSYRNAALAHYFYCRKEGHKKLKFDVCSIYREYKNDGLLKY